MHHTSYNYNSIVMSFCTPAEDPSREARIRERLSFNPRHITELEDWIDQYSVMLPDLTNFILPVSWQLCKRWYSNFIIYIFSIAQMHEC